MSGHLELVHLNFVSPPARQYSATDDRRVKTLAVGPQIKSPADGAHAQASPPPPPKASSSSRIGRWMDVILERRNDKT